MCKVNGMEVAIKMVIVSILYHEQKLISKNIYYLFDDHCYYLSNAIQQNNICAIFVQFLYPCLQINKKLMQAAGMVNRVRQEVGIHSRLSHPSILQLHAFFEDNDFVYLVLELCENGELQHYLKASGHPLNEEEACEVMTQVVEGLLYLHSHNILHRDLSLANLLLTRDMHVVSFL